MFQKLINRFAKLKPPADVVALPTAELSKPSLIINNLRQLLPEVRQVYAPVATLPVISYSNPENLGYSVGIEHWPGDKANCKAELEWSMSTNGPELTLKYSGDLAAVPGACLNIRFFFETPTPPTGFATLGGARIKMAQPERVESICAVYRLDDYAGGNTFPDMAHEMDLLIAHELDAAKGVPGLEFRIAFLKPVSPGEPFEVKFSRIFIGEHFSPEAHGLAAPAYVFPLGSEQKDEADAALLDFEEQALLALKENKLTGVQGFCRPYVVSRGDERRQYPIMIGTANSVHWYGQTNDHNISFFEKSGLVKEGGVVLDCGAHAGRISVHLGHLVGPKGMVFAFDPFPQNNIQIEANAKINGMKNLICEWAGVGPEFGDIEVSNEAQNLMASQQKDVIKVRQVPLDSYIEYNPTFIKIDVEGYEGEVLKGAQKLLRACRPAVLVEVHPQFIGAFGATFESLIALIPLDLYDIWTQFIGGRPARRYYPGINEVVGNIVDIIAIPKSQPNVAKRAAH